MEVSIHCGRRYCERIKSIAEKGSGPYYHQNKEQIDSELLKLHSHAEEFFKGKMKNHPERSYLIHRNIILVASEDSLVTVFKVKFGNLSEDKTTDVLKIMLSDLEEQVLARNDEESSIKDDLKVFNEEIGESRTEIERLKGLIEIEQHHINANTEYKQASQKKLKQLDYALYDTFEAIIGKGFAGEL